MQRVLSIVRVLAPAVLATHALAQGETCKLQRIAPSGATATPAFGIQVACSAAYVVASAIHDGDLGTQAGAAYVYVPSGAGWTQDAKLYASDGAASHEFGVDVALSGDTIAVSARAPGGQPTDDHGAVYVFVRNGSAWVEQARLTPPSSESWPSFGDSVAIDGDTLVAGSSLAMPFGAAWVFVRSGSTWTLQARLDPATGLPNDHFGSAVAIEGDRIVVGAEYQNCGSSMTNSPCGAAYVFERSGTSWSERAKLVDPLSGQFSLLGNAVDISGGRIVVAEWPEKAFVYVENAGVWTVEAELVPSPFTDLPNGTYAYAHSVAIDGDRIAVGDPYNEVPPFNQTSSGATYVFGRFGTAWSWIGKLISNDIGSASNFGRALDWTDGNLVVGAYTDSSKGALYVHQASPYTAFCFGDGSLATACPCAPPDDVPSPSGAPRAGCAASFNPDGVRLTACGAVAPSDGLRLIAEMRANYAAFAFAIQGETSIASGFAAGDGLRCVGGTLIRFGGHFGQVGGEIPPTFGNGFWIYPYWGNTQPISAATAQAPGQTAYYQVVYRNSAAGHCNPSTYNLTNGIAVAWPP